MNVNASLVNAQIAIVSTLIIYSTILKVIPTLQFKYSNCILGLLKIWINYVVRKDQFTDLVDNGFHRG